MQQGVRAFAADDDAENTERGHIDIQRMLSGCKSGAVGYKILLTQLMQQLLSQPEFGKQTLSELKEACQLDLHYVAV